MAQRTAVAGGDDAADRGGAIGAGGGIQREHLPRLGEGLLRAGQRHAGLEDRRQIAGVVLEAIMFNVFSRTIGGPSAELEDGDPAEELWDLIFQGMRSNPQS